jgi:hypothetical protein
MGNIKGEFVWYQEFLIELFESYYLSYNMLLLSKRTVLKKERNIKQIFDIFYLSGVMNIY